MKLTETVYSILLNEYSQSIMIKLINKFKTEDPNLTDEIIIRYIGDFKKISSKLENRDILTYSWKDLETAVDSNRSVRVKAGKIDVTAEDSNLLYNKDGIRLYHANNKKACIKYSNGYSFCIGARGEDNMYNYYRFKSSRYNKTFDESGTPYFVFNDNLDKNDPRHVLVIFLFKQPDVDKSHSAYFYTVTDAKNDGDTEYDEIGEVVKDYPWVNNLVQYIQPQELDDKEKDFYNNRKVLNKKLDTINREFKKYALSKSNYVTSDFWNKLTNFLFEKQDYLNRDETTEFKYNAMMNGARYYVADLDKMHEIYYENGGDNSKNVVLKDVISNLDDWFSRAVIITQPDNYDVAVIDYAKKVIMPNIKKNYKEIVKGKFDTDYDYILSVVVQSLKETKKQLMDLEQIKAITINKDSTEMIKEYIRTNNEMELLKKKYSDII